VTPAGGSARRGSTWCLLVGIWSLVFAAPHFYWAAGGRAGLGAQVGAADVALAQGWFAAYNLAAGCLGILGALLALALDRGWAGPRLHRPLLVAAAVAGAVLLARGVLGVTLLVIDELGGAPGGRPPAVLLAIEPWFVLGGLAYAGLAWSLRGRAAALSP
jgi:hypothetical protein